MKGAGGDSEVVVVFGSAKKSRWSEEGIDKMESLVKKIRVDQREDPGNAGMGGNNNGCFERQAL
jgi:hypothetical protein